MADSPPPLSPLPPATVDTSRDEMHAAPPFLTWQGIYAIVVGALVVQVALYAALTAAYR